MKKKGLIISTIVMVLVLAVSLTTATYAWFTTSSVTSIEGFSVAIKSSNFVNIGFNANSYQHVTNGSVGAANFTDFVTGAVIFTAGDAGKLGGFWTGDTAGLSNELTHNIKWGQQSAAVGVVPTTAKKESTAEADYSTFFEVNSVAGNYGGDAWINATTKSTGSTLATPVLAVANTKGEGENANGDYVHFIMGAQPAVELSSNQLIILVDGSGSTHPAVGILSAIHVAYRVTKHGEATGSWTEVDLYGTNHHNSTRPELDAGWGVSSTAGSIAKAYKDTYSNGSGSFAEKPSNSAYVAISGLSTAASTNEFTIIDQIEVIIYIAGSDSDCVDAAKGASGEIKIFFNAVAVTSGT